MEAYSTSISKSGFASESCFYRASVLCQRTYSRPTSKTSRFLSFLVILNPFKSPVQLTEERKTQHTREPSELAGPKRISLLSEGSVIYTPVLTRWFVSLVYFRFRFGIVGCWFVFWRCRRWCSNWMMKGLK